MIMLKICTAHTSQQQYFSMREYRVRTCVREKEMTIQHFCKSNPHDSRIHEKFLFHRANDD